MKQTKDNLTRELNMEYNKEFNKGFNKVDWKKE